MSDEVQDAEIDRTPLPSVTGPETVDQYLEDVPIDSIALHPLNPRRGNVEEISASIQTNGFYGACIVQKSSRYIIAGNHRYKAAKALGALTVPAVIVDVDDITARRIMLADNRTSDLAGYHDDLLAMILSELAVTDTGLTGTGYKPDDIDALMQRQESTAALADRLIKPIRVSIGSVRVDISPEQYDQWRESIQTDLGLDDAVIEAEIRQRLGL